MPRVLITPPTLDVPGAPYLGVLKNAGLDAAFAGRPEPMAEGELVAALQGAAAVVAGCEKYPRRVLEACPGLRVVARVGVGYDAVDVAAATTLAVAVTITPGTNHGSAAEHTFALILGVAKRLATAHPAVRAGAWPLRPNIPLRGRTLGIAGLGRIGKEVALRGAAFGMRLTAWDPFPDRAFLAAHGVTLVSFEQLLGESDFLTLHAPLTPESRHLIDARALARMKPTAVLVNTSRGGLVDEPALAAALAAGRLAGAGLDVFEREPPVEHRALLDLDNVLLTPHNAGLDEQSRDDMGTSACESVAALLTGGWPEDRVVNPEVRAAFGTRNGR